MANIMAIALIRSNNSTSTYTVRPFASFTDWYYSTCNFRWRQTSQAYAHSFKANQLRMLMMWYTSKFGTFSPMWRIVCCLAYAHQQLIRILRLPAAAEIKKMSSLWQATPSILASPPFSSHFLALSNPFFCLPLLCKLLPYKNFGRSSPTYSK